MKSRLRLDPRSMRSAKRYGGSVKVVEVPPGPPVQSPLVAEVYGPDYDGQQKVAAELRELFAKHA